MFVFYKVRSPVSYSGYSGYSGYSVYSAIVSIAFIASIVAIASLLSAMYISTRQDFYTSDLPCLQVFDVLCEFLQERGDAHAILDDSPELIDVHALLLHRVAVTQGDGVVF